MADTSGKPTTIKLKATGRYDEVRAGGAVKCGHLVSLASTGKYVVHATAHGRAANIFATEEVNVLRGKTISDDYALDDLMSILLAAPGDEVYAWLLDEENVVIGDALSSGANGSLRKYVAPTVASDDRDIVAYALEALNLTGASGDGRIKVRVK